MPRESIPMNYWRRPSRLRHRRETGPLALRQRKSNPAAETLASWRCPALPFIVVSPAPPGGVWRGPIMFTSIRRPNRKFPLAVGVELSTQNARRCGRGAVRDGGRASGIAMALTCALALALASTPATARTYARHKFAQKDHKQAEHVSKEPFGDVRKGPQQIFISIDQQKLHLYSDGVHVADTSVATGVLSLPTPLGVFSVIQKQVFHRSNIYSNAPMPFMQRITWSGVAMHEGENIGHPAAQAAAPPAESVKTAQSVDSDKTTDAAATAPVSAGSAARSADPPADAAPSRPNEIGLRAGKD